MRIRKKEHMGDKKLKKVVIPAGTVEIEDWAYANCTALCEIRIPDSMRQVSEKAFLNCDALREVYLYREDEDGVRRITDIDPQLLALAMRIWPKDTGRLLEAAKDRDIFYAWLDQRIPEHLALPDDAGFVPFQAGGEEDYGTEEEAAAYRYRSRLRKAGLIYERLLVQDTDPLPETILTAVLQWLKAHDPEAAFGVIIGETKHKEGYLDLYFAYGLDAGIRPGVLEEMAGGDTELKAQILRRRLGRDRGQQDTFFSQFRL